MDLKLAGKTISLIPVEEKWLDELFSFSADPLVWQHLPFEIYTKEEMQNWFRCTLEEAAAGKILPFLLQLNETGEILGSTRIYEWDRYHKRAEIGYTWINPKYFGTKINTEAKLLLLDYGFNTLRLNRIQFRIDERNIRSQKAIVKLGVCREAILRNYKFRRDGSVGNVFLYSIIKEEWPAVESLLKGQLK
jgi:RimJ/RimL family protein N-acetyltransferase